jgi:hypothetical protein
VWRDRVGFRGVVGFGFRWDWRLWVDNGFWRMMEDDSVQWRWMGCRRFGKLEKIEVMKERIPRMIRDRT